jgi:hypothetical protein
MDDVAGIDDTTVTEVDVLKALLAVQVVFVEFCPHFITSPITVETADRARVEAVNPPCTRLFLYQTNARADTFSVSPSTSVYVQAVQEAVELVNSEAVMPGLVNADATSGYE